MLLKIGSHVAQASFELLITLPLPPENVGIAGVYLHIQYYYRFSLFRFIYFTFSIVFAYVDDCALHVRILPTGTGRRYQTLWNYKQFWVTMWVLGIKSGSSKRVTSALNYCVHLSSPSFTLPLEKYYTCVKFMAQRCVSLQIKHTHKLVQSPLLCLVLKTVPSHKGILSSLSLPWSSPTFSQPLGAMLLFSVSIHVSNLDILHK